MSDLLNSEPRYSRKELAYEAIKREIITHKLKPGVKLVERQLCESLNISRTPVREALQQLVGEGLARFIQGEGVIVADITYEDIREIFDIREVLEGMAVREFASLAKEAEIEKLAEIVAGFTEDHFEDGQMFIRYDRKFHNAIIEGAQNIKLSAIMSNINDQIEWISYLIHDDREKIKTAHQQHRNIFNAIKQRSQRTAEELMRGHISTMEEYHLQNLRGLRTLMQRS